MLYVILFEDNPNASGIRTRDMPAHLSFLERNADRIRAAGPLREAATASVAGGMWLVEAESPEAVEALYREDPFWTTGLRRSVRVCQWHQVFADGRRQV